MLKRIFFIFILFYFCLAEINLYNNWILDINYGESIELTPGAYTRVILELANNNYLSNYDEFLYWVEFLPGDSDSDFIYSIKDVVMDHNQYYLYATYIGLKCKDYSQTNLPKLYINVYYSEDRENFYRIYKNIELTLKFNFNKISIDLELLSDEMPEKSLNFFKLKNELFNVEQIDIEPLNINPLDKVFDLEKITIDEYFKREELSEENIANHGILFDYPLKLQKTIQDLDNFPFNVRIKNETLTKCFDLKTLLYKVQLYKGEIATIDEKVKTAIKYNTYIDKNNEITNSIKIKSDISVAPVILTCEFTQITSFSHGINNNRNNIKKIFKTFIKEPKQIDIMITNLEGSSEFIANCEISNTDYNEKTKQAINITIGNYEKADIIKQLMPIVDQNRIEQCVTFYFSNDPWCGMNSIKFYAELYCLYVMKRDESLYLRALSTVQCEGYIIDSKAITFCVAPLPLYNYGAFLTQQDKQAFDNKFQQFIFDEVNYLSLLRLYVQNYETISDIEINKKSINVELEFKRETNPMTLAFIIKSTHKQRIECFYNSELDEKNQFNLINNSITIYPNEESHIQTTIPSLHENKMYSLNLICYNSLPGSNLGYKTTGIMTMYTYLHLSGDMDQTKEEIFNETTINCKYKKNLNNPRCLNEKYFSILPYLNTEIPLVLKEIENQREQFIKMTQNAKYQYLVNLYTDIQRNFLENPTFNLTFFFEKLIIFNKYLTFIDCSMYSSGSSNKIEETFKADDYVKCRENKQNHIKSIINVLKANLQILDCPLMIQAIISQFEENPEMNLKYILILINELSNNPESYTKGQSQVLFNTVLCLQDKFDAYWPKFENTLIETKQYLDSSISAIKRDVSYLILQTLVNLAKIIHYDELDGNTKDEKTKTGIILNNDYIQIQNKILDFSKKLNEFGDSYYSLSSSTFTKIETNKGLNVSLDSEIQIINITDKDIIIKAYSNYLLRNYKAKTMQILIFDSPIISIHTSEEEEASDSVNTFISITLYDENGKEIPIKNINKKYRPEILYLKEGYDSLKKCFYYNEKKKELESEGVVIDEAYQYKGRKYIKCTSSHLTAFTAGTYNFNSNTPWWIVLLIVAAIFLFFILFIFIFIIVKRRTKSTFKFNPNTKIKEMNELQTY